jgi:hypothetical protein
MSNKITTWISHAHGDFPTLHGFRYWWLKEVTGYRLDVHCQACLLGPLNRKISRLQPVGERIHLNGDLVYLCGVSNDFSMDKNFHAPAELAVGESFTLPTYNGFTVNFDNARLIPIKPLPEKWNGLDKWFTRCRNYQFAVQMEERRILTELI